MLLCSGAMARSAHVRPPVSVLLFLLALASLASSEAQQPSTQTSVRQKIQETLAPELEDAVPKIMDMAMDPVFTVVQGSALRVEYLKGLSSINVTNVTVSSLETEGDVVNVTASIASEFRDPIQALVSVGGDGFHYRHERLEATLANFSFDAFVVTASFFNASLVLKSLELKDLALGLGSLRLPPGAEAVKLDPMDILEPLLHDLKYELGVQLSSVPEGLRRIKIQRAMMSDVVKQLPTMMRQAGLDPIRTLVDTEELKVTDVKGLSSISARGAYFRYTEKGDNIDVTATVWADFQKPVQTTATPEGHESVDALLKGLKISNLLLGAKVDMATLELKSLEVEDVELEMDDPRFPADAEAAENDPGAVVGDALRLRLKDGLGKQLSSLDGQELQRPSGAAVPLEPAAGPHRQHEDGGHGERGLDDGDDVAGLAATAFVFP